jgi:hypothetical protein
MTYSSEFIDQIKLSGFLTENPLLREVHIQTQFTSYLVN